MQFVYFIMTLSVSVGTSVVYSRETQAQARAQSIPHTTDFDIANTDTPNNYGIASAEYRTVGTIKKPMLIVLKQCRISLPNLIKTLAYKRHRNDLPRTLIKTKNNGATNKANEVANGETHEANGATNEANEATNEAADGETHEANGATNEAASVAASLSTHMKHNRLRPMQHLTNEHSRPEMSKRQLRVPPVQPQYNTMFNTRHFQYEATRKERLRKQQAAARLAKLRQWQSRSKSRCQNDPSARRGDPQLIQRGVGAYSQLELDSNGNAFGSTHVSEIQFDHRSSQGRRRLLKWHTRPPCRSAL